MKILLTSDTHIGITYPSAIEKMLQEAVAEKPDMIIHAGDYSGGLIGHRGVTSTVKLIRKYFPETTYLSTIGNHDYWIRGARIKNDPVDEMFLGPQYRNPSLSQFNSNLKKIEDTFHKHNVIFLDNCPLITDEFIFIGVSGWYNHPRPRTNDQRYLPIGIEGDTNAFLLKQSWTKLEAHIEYIKEFNLPAGREVVFISHFPVVNTGPDYKGGFEEFCWDAKLVPFLQEELGVKKFINGHAHQLHTGPLRYESGSDYYLPKYTVIEV